MDTFYPRKSLKIEVVNDPMFQTIIKFFVEAETLFFGIVGTARNGVTGHDMVLQNGCEVEATYGKTQAYCWPTPKLHHLRAVVVVVSCA